ncbi:MAG: BON domain-containing protein [Candidatus Sulfotelmatobacter sp.]
MHRRMPVVLFALIAALAANVSCARKPDDAKISSDIQSKYAQDSGLSTKQLSVQASSGVVTIGGYVDNDAQRTAAARQAASVDGVKEVVNNLQVGIPSNASAAAATPSKNAVMNAERSKADKNSSVFRKSNHSHAARDSAMADDSGPASDSVIANDSQEPPPLSSDQPPADSSSSDTPPIPAAPPQPLKVTIEQGTPISVRLIDSIDSEKNQIGDTFHASLNAPLSAEGSTAFPAGTDVAGHIVDLKSASKFAGQSLVVLQLDSITSNGNSYSVQTDQFRKEGSSRGKSTAEKVGGGAILGGIIGAIAGGGRGAAIGTAAGAGVGGGAQAASKSQQIKLPSETVLNFTLQAPVTIINPTAGDAARPKLGDAQ